MKPLRMQAEEYRTCSVAGTMGAYRVAIQNRDGHLLIRITPTPIVLRRRSGYFSRVFSACSLAWLLSWRPKRRKPIAHPSKQSENWTTIVEREGVLPML
jgi:hypothetical protein